MLAARYGAGQWRIRGVAPNLAVAVVAALTLGLLIYNDPMTLYLLLAPLGAALFVRWVRRGGTRDLGPLAVLAAGLPCASLWQALFARLHVSTVKVDTTFVSFDQLGYHVTLAFRCLVTLFNADIFGQSPLQFSTIGSLLNFALLTLVFAAPLILWPLRHRFGWWQWFALVQPQVSVAILILSNQAVNLGSTRYLVLVPFYGAISLAILAGMFANVRVRMVLSAAIVVCVLINIVPMARTLKAGYQDPNAHNAAIIRVARQHGLTKGYAQYWTGSINTYLSGNQIQFIPTVCLPDGAHVYRWLMDDGVVDQPAQRTFYLYDTRPYPASGPSRPLRPTSPPRPTSARHPSWSGSLASRRRSFRWMTTRSSTSTTTTSRRQCADPAGLRLAPISTREPCYAAMLALPRRGATAPRGVPHVAYSIQ